MHQCPPFETCVEKKIRRLFPYVPFGLGAGFERKVLLYTSSMSMWSRDARVYKLDYLRDTGWFHGSDDDDDETETGSQDSHEDNYDDEQVYAETLGYSP